MLRVRFGLTFRTALASVLLGVLVVGGFGLMTFAVLELRAAAAAQVRSVRVLVTANALERRAIDLQTGLRGYLITRRPAFLTPYLSARATYPGLVRQLRSLISDTPGQQVHITLIAAGINRYVRRWAEPRIRDIRAGQVAKAAQMTSTGGGKTQIDALRAEFAAFSREEAATAAARSRDADRLGSLALVLGITGMAVSGLAVLSASVGIQHGVVRPLRRLAGATVRLSAGDLTARVPERGAAETGELSRGFNAMAASLQDGRDQLTEQRARLAEALSLAEEAKAHSEILRQFGDRLAGISGVGEVGAAALQGMADSAGADIGVLYLQEDSTERFVPVARRGLGGPGLAPAGSILPGEGLAGRAVSEQRLIQVSSGQGALLTAGISGGQRAGHELHLPLRHAGRPIGVMSLGRITGEPFTEPDLAVLEDLSAQAAVACAEALSVERTERTAHELETVLSSTDEGIFAIAPATGITMVNDATLEQTGYTREELLGRNAHQVLHHSHPDGSSYPQAECPIYQVFQTGMGKRVADEVFWRADGSPVPVEYSCYPLLEEGGITGVVVTFIDITARKRTEAQRDTQHAVTRVLAEAGAGEDIWDRALAAACRGLQLPVGFGWLPRQHSARLELAASYAAPGFGDMAGLLGHEELAAGEGPAGLALTRRAPVLFRYLDREPPRPGLPPDPRLRSAVAIPAVAADGRVLAIAEFFGDRDLAEEGLVSTLTSLAGQISQFIERMRAEARTQRMQNEFVSTVSHDLRTPLTSITGWLHILLGGEPGPLTEEQRHFLNTIRRNSDRLLRQVGDLLLAGQLESGQLSLDLAEVDMANIIRDVTDLVSAHAEGKRITLTVDADGPAVVRGDRERLVQLLDNLAMNAIKFTPADGRVGITVSRADGRCRVAVSDTGIGIPPEDRPHLFRRFFRSSAATAHGISGTGLGLSICKAIAEGHHGTVYLAEQEGPGSVFVVELPLAAQKEAAA